MNNKIFPQVLLAALVSFFSTSALSAGFQLSETSATGLGRAFAGEAALADNAAAQFRNPAMLRYLAGTQISGGAIFLNPNIDVKGVTTTNAQEKFSTSSKDLVKSSVIPNVSLSHQLNDDFYLGVALGSHFGIESKLDDDFKAIQFGNELQMTTFEINPNFAYKISSEWTVGVGVRFVKGEVAIGSKSSGGNLPAGTTLKHFKGDDFGVGWQIGTAWQIDENNRIGFNYRSAVNLSFEGNATGSAFGATGAFASTMDFALPASSEIASFHKIDNKIKLHTSLNWTDWNAFNKSEVHVSSLTPSTHVIHQENWMDTYRFSLGGTYQFDKKTTLRSGIAYDLSAATDPTRTIIFPESNRLWLSMGAGYEHSKSLTFDIGFAYIVIDKANLKGPQPCFDHQHDVTQYGGSFVGDITGNIWMMGAQASYRF